MTARLRYYGISLLLFVALLTSSAQAAYAYVDPGTGLLMFQGASAFVTGALFYFRRRLKLLFVRERTLNQKPESSL